MCIPEISGRIQQAIAERRVLQLRYFTASRGAERERRVHPYTVAQRFGHWYLYGYDESRSKALPFRLDRVRECAITDVPFEPPSETELAKARLFSETAGEPVRIKLGRRSASWALARASQIKVLRRSARGDALVEVGSAGEEWAIRFALSLAGDAEVVSPPSARRHFSDAVRRTLARYR